MNNLTVIITASFIKSHPSIDFIRTVIESFKNINITKTTPIILAHDYSENPLFKQYLHSLEIYIQDKQHIKIIVRDNHGHLTGNVRNAFRFVDTEYVLIVQHDLPYIRAFDIQQIIQDMSHTTELKHVRFNKRKTIKTGFDARSDLFGKQIKSLHNTYTRTPGWSDNNHICRSDYYRNVVLAESKDGKPMESYLNGRCTDETSHDKYGTYIYGGLNEMAYITHIDGRNKFTLPDCL